MIKIINNYCLIGSSSSPFARDESHELPLLCLLLEDVPVESNVIIQGSQYLIFIVTGLEEPDEVLDHDLLLQLLFLTRMLLHLAVSQYVLEKLQNLILKKGITLKATSSLEARPRAMKF